MTTNKPCIDCGQQKTLADFYRLSNSADGAASVCKDCHEARMKRRRLTDPGVQQRDRERYHLSPERMARTAASAARWNVRHPEAYRAHYAVSNAIRDGRLAKQPCTICGELKTHAHHRDYGKPLDVTWLCVKCHTLIHAAFPELSGYQQT
jgi:hypothetical protein